MLANQQIQSDFGTLDAHDPQQEVGLQYAKITLIYNDTGSTWQDVMTDRLPAYIEAYPSDADGKRVNENHVLRLKSSNADHMQGFHLLEVDDVVAYLPSDRTESLAHDETIFYDGYLQPIAGKDEARWADLSQPFMAKIIGHQLLAPNRWKYAWEKQQRTATGFIIHSDGWQGSTTANFSINSIEHMNIATGLQGNGVDTSAADFPTGFSIQPVPLGAILMLQMSLDEAGDFAFSFAYENAVDGSCS